MLGSKSFISKINKLLKLFIIMAYRILKQFVPVDTNQGDPDWAKRQIWVSKLNAEDSVDEFDTLEEAETKKVELETADPSARVYKIVEI